MMEYIKVFENDEGVKGFFTTIQGGVSPRPWATMNFGQYTEDRPENVAENRRLMFAGLGLSGNVSVCPIQVHGNSIAVITEKDLESAKLDCAGLNRQLIIPDTDGLVTACKDVILTTVHADCAAVFLYDPKNRVIGLAHAGWQGTEKGIAVKAAEAMVNKLGSSMCDIKACISPCISSCCFGTGTDVYERLNAAWGFTDCCAIKKKDGKYRIDLKELNRRQLWERGIRHVEVSSHCTCCEPGLFFSYRREKGNTGRMGAGLCLTNI